MVNAKKIYNELLNGKELLDLVDSDRIFSSWPDEVKDFPCVIFLDENQSDGEYADNQALVSILQVSIHIFSKRLEGFATTSEIGSAVANIMNGDSWSCSQNGEIPDPQSDVEHRVMKFKNAVYNS